MANGPRLHEFLAEMNREVGLSAQNLLTVGEMPGSTIELAREVTDPARDELNMVFTFEHVGLDEQTGLGKWALLDLALPVLKGNLAEWQRGLADVGWNSLYLDNHDQPRAVSRFGDDSPEHRVSSAKTLATVLHLHRGTPYVYQGEELGMTNSYFTSIEQYQDLEAVNWYREELEAGRDSADLLRSLATKGRDNARTPMHWDDSEHAGFTTGEPWLPAHPNKDHVNAAAAVADEDSVFHHFRRLIALRHADPVVVDGCLRAAAARARAAVGVHPHARRRRPAGPGELLLGAGEGRGVRRTGPRGGDPAARHARRGRARAGPVGVADLRALTGAGGAARFRGRRPTLA